MNRFIKAVKISSARYLMFHVQTRGIVVFGKVHKPALKMQKLKDFKGPTDLALHEL